MFPLGRHWNRSAREQWVDDVVVDKNKVLVLLKEELGEEGQLAVEQEEDPQPALSVPVTQDDRGEGDVDKAFATYVSDAGVDASERERESEAPVEVGSDDSDGDWNGDVVERPVFV